VAERFIAPTLYIGERVQARPWVRIPPDPPVCYHAYNMKVEKKKFDNILTKLIQAKPEPRKAIKTEGRKGPKTPILAKQ
jgi:hypothetical protein